MWCALSHASMSAQNFACAAAIEASSHGGAGGGGLPLPPSLPLPVPPSPPLWLPLSQLPPFPPSSPLPGGGGGGYSGGSPVSPPSTPSQLPASPSGSHTIAPATFSPNTSYTLMYKRFDQGVTLVKN